MAEPSPGSEKTPIVIKKYANRRLYNTATSSYVTLDYLCQMVKDGADFVVYDAKSGEDITRSVLTQIIVEEESKGQNLLPINFLRQLISFYGDNLQFLLPRYLEQSMEAFAHNQEQMRNYLKDSFGGIFPFGRFEELGKQNMAFLEHAMRMWNPFKAAADMSAAEKAAGPGPAKTAPENQNLDSLKAQMDAIQRQVEALSRLKKDS